jgi:hypothetical protein
LARSEKLTIICERRDVGKIRATSLTWDEPKVIVENDVRQVQNRQGLLQVTRIAVGTDEIAASPSPAVDPSTSNRHNVTPSTTDTRVASSNSCRNNQL